MKACIAGMAYHLPNKVLTNEQIAAQFPDWPAERIEQKVGICERHIAAGDECSSDLAVAAAERLFAAQPGTREKIDYLLLCTQSPDYFLPTTACLIQERLHLSTACGALDFNLGCSGFVYGLGLAKGLIESGQARHVLLLTAETYSKFMHPDDKGVRTLFGDAAAATLISGIESHAEAIGPFVFGTDGRGATDLIVAGGAMRRGGLPDPQPTTSEQTKPSADHLFMNGPAIFTFTLREIPKAIDLLLQRANLMIGQVDLFVFHQANSYMLEQLRKKMRIPVEKFAIHMRTCGNTVSSTIPIVLTEWLQSGKIKPDMRIMLVGFGVGLSWGATMLRFAEIG